MISGITSLSTWFLVGLIVITSYTDLRFHRLRNVHTGGGLILGLVLGLFSAGIEGLCTALAGAGVGLTLMGLLFVLHVVKAGDAKLAAALGSFFGPILMPQVILMSFVLFIPIGFIALVVRGQLKELWTACKRFGYYLYSMVHPGLSTVPPSMEAIMMAPFGAVLGIASLWVKFWGPPL